MMSPINPRLLFVISLALLVCSLFRVNADSLSVSPTPPNDLVIPAPPAPQSAEPLNIAFVMVQGADILPQQYSGLCRAVQHAAVSGPAPIRVWVGVPEFPKDMADPLVLDRGVQRVLEKLTRLGMPADAAVVAAGHSLGGAMVQLWTEKHVEQVSAQILMGSFLTHHWKKDYIFSYPVDTLTIGGELDGLARVTRIAEAFYTQLLDPAVPQTDSGAFPVTVILGVTHMQFAEGEPPKLVEEMDLLPEVTYDEAHTAIANDIVTFLKTRLNNVPSKEKKQAMTQLEGRLNETRSFIDPILTSLHYEGYHNFRPPCLCPTDTCPPMDNCTNACPFTNEVSQVLMGSGLEGLVIANTDSFHDVWETEPTVHLPAVLNSCDSPSGCTLQTTTITQGVYHTGEDLEIWKKHFDVPFLDSGFLPISARELRTKMSARQNIYKHAGIADPSFDELDGGDVRCSEINQKSWDWAVNTASSKTTDRFTSHGQPFVMGKDIDVCPAGPCWIWNELQFNVTQSGDAVELRSPQFSTAIDFWLPKTRGFHYCKVLSPARSMEWIYVDGLRAKYSLRSAASKK